MQNEQTGCPQNSKYAKNKVNVRILDLIEVFRFCLSYIKES